VTDRDDTLATWRDLLGGRLAAGTKVALPVLTGSMMPLLPPGSEVEIALDPAAPAAPGDIVVFREGAGLTAHRVLLAVPLPGGGLLYQKGDANPRGAWIRRRRVMGLVVAVTRPDGTRLALDTSQARREGRRGLWRRLRRDVRDRLQPRRPGPLPLPRTVPPRGTLITLDAVPVPARGVTLLPDAGESALLRDGAGGLHAIGGPGPFIWRQIDGERTLRDILDRVTGEYAVTGEAAAGDLLAFVETLASRGLVLLLLPAAPDAAPEADR